MALGSWHDEADTRWVKTKVVDVVVAVVVVVAVAVAEWTRTGFGATMKAQALAREVSQCAP